MTATHLFEALKKDKQPQHTSSAGNAEAVVFCLLFDVQGAYIEVRNEKGRPADTDYLHYSGVVRSILKSIHGISQRGIFWWTGKTRETKFTCMKMNFLLSCCCKASSGQTKRAIQYNPLAA